MKDIFVGNLEYKTSEDELRQLFAAYGPVDHSEYLFSTAWRSAPASGDSREPAA